MTGNKIKSSFLYAVKRSVPILVGYFPVGIAYGILMNEIGLNFLWSGLICLTVYAGSLQMLMISFFAAGTSVPAVALTALLLNSRHIFYGLSFIEKFREYGPWKWLMIYTLSDENYSLLCSYKAKDDVDEKLSNIFSSILVVLYWTFFSMLGGLVGSLITFDTTGIDFALTALFVVILLDQMKDAPTKIPALIGAGSSVLCILIFGTDNFLLPALIITVVILVFFRAKLEKSFAGEGEA